MAWKSDAARLTVRELKAALQDLDDDEIVVIEYDGHQTSPLESARPANLWPWWDEPDYDETLAAKPVLLLVQGDHA